MPLAKLAYNAIGLDPDTLVAEVDPGYSDAMYYAVECQDYAFYPNAGDPDARLTAWVAGAEAEGINDHAAGDELSTATCRACTGPRPAAPRSDRLPSSTRPIRSSS